MSNKSLTHLDVTKNELYNSLTEVTEKLLYTSDFNKLLFFSYYLLTVQREFDNKIPTACAGLMGNLYKIKVGTNFWLNKANCGTYLQRAGLLLHETMHIIHQDVLNYEFYDNHQLFNIAADYFTNSLLIDSTPYGETVLPGIGDTTDWENNWKPKQEALAAQRDSGTITQEEFELKFKELPIRPIHPDDCESDEITVANCIANGVDWIYSKLEKLDPNGQNSQQSYYSNNNLGDATGHDWKEFNELHSSTKQFARDQLDHQLKQAAQQFEAGGSTVGSLPGYLQDILEKLMNPPKPVYNWKKAIKSWTSTRGTYTRITSTRMKVNLLIEDGRRLKFAPNKYLLLMVDTSGSMSKEDLKEVMTEAYNIKKVSNCRVDVAEVDYAMHNVWEMKSLEQINKRLATEGIAGRGGTSVDPGIKYLNENPKYSGAIYLTDGWVGAPTVQRNKPLLTVVTSGGDSSFKWEGVPNVKIPNDYFETN